MNGFTPGPWSPSKAKWGDQQWGCRAGEGDETAGGILPTIAFLEDKDNSDFDIYICSRRADQEDREIPDKERWHNAYLIASAPDMYEVLERIVYEVAGKGGITPNTFTEALRIMAQTRG